VRRPQNATTNSIAPGVLNDFVFENLAQREIPQIVGADTEVLLNFEYRIPIIGPVQFVPFLDVGSAFNLRKYGDQFIRTGFLPDQFLGSVALNPRGLIATPREIEQARTPETPPNALPPGFKIVRIFGEQQIVQQVKLSEINSGIFDNYRISTGAEFRVQVPVINVPFRLIFAWNPNAKTDIFVEDKKAIRFSVGRTF
jgi:outer membrane protein insertion porin family